ncbi:MAG: bacterial transcriptional activator domain-containing protein [Gammaproteobacteria bacterium]
MTDRDSLRQALALYKGNFLSNETDTPWALPMRDRLQARYASALTRLAMACQRDGDHHSAVTLYKQGLETDVLREEYYQGLMRSFIALGTPEEARQAFEICKRRLAMNLNRKPTAATLALYQSIGERQDSGK